jgi:hypothetical protein
MKIPFVFHTLPGSFWPDPWDWPLSGCLGQCVVGATEYQVMPCAGTFSHLQAGVSVAPGLGKSYSFALNVNGVASLPMTISGPALTGSNMADTKAVVAGDLVYIATSGTAGLAACEMSYCMLFEPAVDGQQPFLGWCVGSHEVAAVYAGISGGVSSDAAHEAQVHSVVPFPGKFKLFYARDDDEVVPAGETITVTFRRNGAPTAMVLTLTVGERLESDLVTEIACVAGDYVDWQVTCVTGHPVMMLSCCYIPDDPKLWWLPRPRGNSPLTDGAIAYTWPTLGYTHMGLVWAALEADAPSCLTPFPKGVVITGIAALLDVAPGAGKSRTLTVRKNQVDTAVKVTIANADTFGILSLHPIEPEDFDMFTVSNIRTGLAAAASGTFAIFGGAWSDDLRHHYAYGRHER